MGYLIGLGIELAVGNALPFMQQCHGIGSSLGLRLETGMNGPGVVFGWLSMVPGLKQLRLARRWQTEAVYRQLRVFQPLFQYMHEALGETFDFIGLEKRFVVDVLQPDLIRVRIGPYVQGKRRLFMAVGAFDRVGSRFAERETVIAHFV
ncbi:hypothetical protein PSCICN_09350 [Pseudomonas cichorii]|nr:hypothetical protein PSCICN_09350 [Pseudomonas cichorii]